MINERWKRLLWDKLYKLGSVCCYGHRRLDRGHREIYISLCQFLTKQDFFRKYLYKIGKLESPLCKHCPEESIHPIHHFFYVCGRFTEDRRLLASSCMTSHSGYHSRSDTSRRVCMGSSNNACPHGPLWKNIEGCMTESSCLRWGGLLYGAQVMWPSKK